MLIFKVFRIMGQPGADIVTLQMSDSVKQTYSRGASMIQKMGYAGIGPIGASGEGIWNLVPKLEPPKRGCKPIIGIKSILFYYMILVVTMIMKDKRTSSLILTFKVFRILGQPAAEILLHFKCVILLNKLIVEGKL